MPKVADLEAVARGLKKVREAEALVDKAREAERKAVVELAELVGVERRDKDTAIDAVVNAERLIVDAAVEHVGGKPRG